MPKVHKDRKAFKVTREILVPKDQQALMETMGLMEHKVQLVHRDRKD